MNRISVNTSALRNSAQELIQYSTDITRKTAELADKLQSLNSMWEGPAKTAYVNNVHVSRDEFATLCQQIKQMSADMETAASSYERCENNVENEIHSMKW